MLAQIKAQVHLETVKKYMFTANENSSNPAT